MVGDAAANCDETLREQPVAKNGLNRPRCGSILDAQNSGERAPWWRARRQRNCIGALQMNDPMVGCEMGRRRRW